MSFISTVKSQAATFRGWTAISFAWYLENVVVEEQLQALVCNVNT